MQVCEGISLPAKANFVVVNMASVATQCSEPVPLPRPPDPLTAIGEGCSTGWILGWTSMIPDWETGAEVGSEKNCQVIWNSVLNSFASVKEIGRVKKKDSRRVVDTVMFEENRERTWAILNLFFPWRLETMCNGLLIGFKKVRYLPIFLFCFPKFTGFVKITMVTPWRTDWKEARLDQFEGYCNSQVEWW